MTDLPDRATRIAAMIAVWDASGAIKTSAYYRLQSMFASAVADAGKSVAIQRLVDEVKDPKPGAGGGGYNRVYHRHNR